jgi:DNA polymerase-3 subunit alpha
MYLKELESRVVDRIIQQRGTGGPFSSLEDFLDRVPISIEQVSILIRIDAFRSTGGEKHRLLWHAHMVLSRGKITEHPRLFPPQHARYEIPSLYATRLEEAFTQLELLGFCLCSPFELLARPVANRHGSRHLPEYLGRHIDIYGYLVTVKNTSTHNGKRMQFATFIDQDGEVFDTVHFPPVASRYVFRGKGIYRLYGKVVSEFGYLSIEVAKMEKQEYVPDPRYAEMKTGTRLLQERQEHKRTPSSRQTSRGSASLPKERE